jgi:hypothetical protein
MVSTTPRGPHADAALLRALYLQSRDRAEQNRDLPTGAPPADAFARRPRHRAIEQSTRKSVVVGRVARERTMPVARVNAVIEAGQSL